MTFNDMLASKDIDLAQVLVMRHRPPEPKLDKVLPWLAAEHEKIFNAYQQTQGEKVEKALQRADFVASFIRFGTGKALFIGLYKKMGEKTLTRHGFWQVKAYIEMKEKYGMRGFDGEEKRASIQWFDLELVKDFYPHWKGKLVINWPEPAIAWCRRASERKNVFPVHAILDESALDKGMPNWEEFVTTWDDLAILPSKWKAKLAEWRGVYYIFDTSIGRGYVGSASGINNLLGRWEGYSAKGDGGNVLLRKRDPKHFLFSILQRMSPDADPAEVARVETSWKKRLHTRDPNGLNAN